MRAEDRLWVHAVAVEHGATGSNQFADLGYGPKFGSLPVHVYHRHFMVIIGPWSGSHFCVKCSADQPYYRALS